MVGRGMRATITNKEVEVVVDICGFWGATMDTRESTRRREVVGLVILVDKYVISIESDIIYVTFPRQWYCSCCSC